MITVNDESNAMADGSRIHLNAVHAPRVLAASREDFLDGDVVHGGDGVRDALAHRWVARLPSEWNRRHVGRVGFEQDAIERHLLIVSRTSCPFLNVDTPVKPRHKFGNARNNSIAIPALDVKQCTCTRASAGKCSFIIATVSVSASRVCTMSGSPSSVAKRICSANASLCVVLFASASSPSSASSRIL